MTEQQIVEQMLERDWTESDLRLAAQLLTHIESSPTARERVQDLDVLRAALRDQPDRAEPDGGWDAFEERLMGQLRRRRTWADEPLRWLLGPITALAAAVLVVGGAAVVWMRSQPATPAAPVALGAPLPPSYAVMSPGDREQQVRLFDQVAQVFGDRAAWVATSDNSSDVGIGPAPAAQDSKLLILRLSVSRDGKLLSRSDMVVVAGQSAELKVPFEHGQQLRYLVSTTAGGPGDQRQLALWIELHKPGVAQTVAALSTTLATEPGQAVRAGELSTAAGALRFDLGFYEAPQPGVAPGLSPVTPAESDRPGT